VEALITTWNAPKLTAEVLARAGKLKIVGHAAGSVAGISSPALYERGLPVVSANVVMAGQVAEWCLWATLMAWNRFLDYAGIGPVQDMIWEKREKSRAMHQATVAIWGYGDIARDLVRLLKPLGPREILIHSKHLKPEEAAEAGVTLVGFDELFERGDIIHLLGALTPQNIGRVGAGQLAKIKNDAVLINAGRANLVDEQALLAEVKKNRFLTILDVHYAEPLPEDSPLRHLPGVILTPHLAASGREALYIGYILEEFNRFFRGEPLRSEMTRERAAMMTSEVLGKKRRG
jgi:phosphoglycerate dehydrogenase-like enzyme